MTDESFHLTPLDVRRYDFGSKAFRGYDAQKVEDFRNQVADELERLTKLNQDLDAKARGFHEQLRAFRERDKALNDALISAQQLRAEMREQADRESQLILREARTEADRLADAARAEIRVLESELLSLDKSRVTYIAQLRAVIERQLAELGALGAPPAVPRPLPPVAPPAPPPPARRASGERDEEGVADEDAGAPGTDARGHVKTPAWLESLVKE